MEEGNASTRSLQQRIASLVIDTFEKLPNKCKPQRNEWTCLAAIVASSNINNELEILTIASGNKCLGGSKMCPNGTVVNDSHAEVLARRAFKLLLWKIILNNIKEENKRDPVIIDIHLKGNTARKQASNRMGHYMKQGYQIQEL